MTNFLTTWVRLVAAHAKVCLGLIGLLTLVLGWVAVSQFRINSDLGELIQQDAGWRADFDHFEAQFPDLVRTAVVVVKSSSVAALENATRLLLQHINAQPEYFRAVAAPGSEAWFRDHALLYMDLDDLDDMADRLAQAQPWLTAVAEDPSLRGVMRLVEQGLEEELEGDPPEGFATVLQLLEASARRQVMGEDAQIFWTDELFADDQPRYQLIYLKAQSIDGAINGVPRTDAQVVKRLRETLAEVQLPDGVEVQLTGEIPLQHEEIEAAVAGVSLAGWLSLVLLFVVLLVGVRSGKIVAATFSMLAIGVLWTSAYAMLAVGEYNTLSLVFIVMFFGLGVDFALHFSLRYQEAINRGDTDAGSALVHSTRSVGRAISLCTVTTAVGFLGFWPTAYQGLADLGVISAGGMAIAWILTFTYLPAYYAVAGPPRAHQMDLPTSDAVVHALLRKRGWVIGLVALGGITAAAVASKSSFDYSVLALKDPHSESMRALRELQREGLSTDYQLFVVSAAPVDVAAVERLGVVDEVRTPADLVPTGQADKQYVIEDLQGLLFSALQPQRQSAPPDAQAIRRSIQAVAQQAAASDPGLSQALAAVAQADAADLMRWQQAVIANLLQELAWINRALQVSTVEFADLPASVQTRLVAPSGEQLTVVLPAQDIASVSALSAFINGVRGELPSATGRPVIEWGVGQIVIGAFREALLFAIVGITLMILLALRRISTTLLILLPLSLTAVSAFAVSVLIEQPINMANILVLPLIFGLGVDNGIHVVDRYLGEGDVDHLMHSSTPRAVMLSTLTTIGAFTALSLSPHMGTASIGVLLTVSVGFLLLFTVFLLPVLLAGKGAAGG